ncbi:MAG: leucyl/phenylalanyl-tRNA--protein transferase [Blastocatellia bacterium]
MRSRKTALRRIVTPEQVLSAYQQGYFPMSRGRYGEIDWFMSEPRTIIPLDERFKVRRSLRQAIRKTDCKISINANFAEVIRICARHEEVHPEEVWLSEDMIALYQELHRRGLAHSVEVWQQNQMVAGLYGLSLKSAFFGESMFTRISYGSQIALVALAQRLHNRKFKLLDAQMRTPHIAHFGSIDLTHEEYMAVLAAAMTEDCKFVD